LPLFAPVPAQAASGARNETTRGMCGRSIAKQLQLGMFASEPK
jgi:hypothetical protein